MLKQAILVSCWNFLCIEKALYKISTSQLMLTVSHIMLQVTHQVLLPHYQTYVTYRLFEWGNKLNYIVLYCIKLHRCPSSITLFEKKCGDNEISWIKAGKDNCITGNSVWFIRRYTYKICRSKIGICCSVSFPFYME